MKFGGGPVGISSLAVAVGEEPDTLEEVYEPYLIMEGYLKRTSQGRVATELSYKKLKLPVLKRGKTGPSTDAWYPIRRASTRKQPAAGAVRR